MTEQQKNNPPEISVSEKNLEFFNLHPGQRKYKNVVITNTGKSDLQIQDLQVFNIALVVSLKKRS